MNILDIVKKYNEIANDKIYYRIELKGTTILKMLSIIKDVEEAGFTVTEPLFSSRRLLFYIVKEKPWFMTQSIDYTITSKELYSTKPEDVHLELSPLMEPIILNKASDMLQELRKMTVVQLKDDLVIIIPYRLDIGTREITIIRRGILGSYIDLNKVDEVKSNVKTLKDLYSILAEIDLGY